MPSKQLKKVLYAEDESDIRAIAQIALEDIGGFTVKYCKNGCEVLESVKNFSPDLLLLDVMMPEIDGPTVLCELRKIPEFATTPIIFITAKIQSNEIAEYMTMGAIDVISKPFDPMLLAEKIKRAWDKYISH